MLQRKFDTVVKDFFPNAMGAKDTSIHYLGRLQNETKRTFLTARGHF